MKHLWLVCYDVHNNKRRTKLAKALERHCQRVQYSVFECPLDRETLLNLAQKEWLKYINLKEDSLRAYPLPQLALEQVKVWGGRPVYEKPDYLIY